MKVRVLCVGGLDPTGKAGLLADAWAVRRLGGEPLAVATALTAQGGQRFSLNPVPVKVLTAQLAAVLATTRVHAVKLGMIASGAQLAVISRAVARLDVPVVVDPVVESSRGERLSRIAPAGYLAFGAAGRVLTPNQAELAWLAVTPEVALGRGYSALLVKGGDSAVDTLFRTGRRPVQFRSRPVRRDAVHHRGTGCRLASALATALALGDPLETAVRRSRRVVIEFLKTPIMRDSSADVRS